MNQILKRVVWSLGTPEQVDYMATISGMDENERKYFHLEHERKTDQYIMDVMNLSKSAFDDLEASARTKLKIGVFFCINFTMAQHPV